MAPHEIRIRVGIGIMAVGVLATVVMMAGLFTDARPPAAIWFLLLCLGIGFAVIISGFAKGARVRRARTIGATDPAAVTRRRR